MYFIIGASGSGKTACMSVFQKMMPDIACYDFDDIGIPENADKKWRQESTQSWIDKLLKSHPLEDCCLFGQMVPGEIMASPVFKNIQEAHIILLDCADQVRIERLKQRNAYSVDQHMLNWASWLRIHCNDPQWEQHVIKEDCADIMNFDCLSHCSSWPSNIKIAVIDTTGLSIKQVCEKLVKAIT